MNRRLRICIKEWMAAIVIFLCNGVLWWYFRSYLNFMIAMLMLFAVIASAALLWKERNKIRVEAVLPTDAVGKNTAIPLLIQAENDGRWMFPIRVKYTLSNDFTGGCKECQYMGVAKPSGENGVHDMLTMKHYGNLAVHITQVCVYDFLHLFYLDDCARRDSWVVAAPANSQHSEQVERRIAHLMPEESFRRSPDYSADYEIREYRPQDSMRDIHWKLTAKQDKLMVRERLSEGKPAVNVLLALSPNADENDARMEVLDGLCRQLLEEKYSMKLYWSKETYHFSSPEELDVAIYEILSGTGIANGGNVSELFGDEHPGEEAITVGGDAPILSEEPRQ